MAQEFHENPHGVLRTVKGVMETYNLSRRAVMQAAEEAGAIVRIHQRVVRIDVAKFEVFLGVQPTKLWPEYCQDMAEYSLPRVVQLQQEIDHLREATKMVPKWRSVSERLPKEQGRYLCNVKSFAFPGCTYISILQYDKYGFREENIYTDDVTHWMPLPEPPGTEGGGVMGWKHCDPMARAKCPDRKLCELDATFADGSECDKFNEKCLGEAPTVADHFRAMSDFELMQFLWKLDSQDLGYVIKFCGKSHVCDELDVDEITEGMCQRCLLAKLQQPYESEETP